MEKTRILAVAPYEGLKGILTEEAKTRGSEVELSVYVGDLSDGLSVARSQMEKGFDIILSRGGTAEMIRENLSLPVVDIVPTVLDVLRIVRLARNMPYKHAIVAFPAISSIAAKLFDLVEQSEDVFTIHTAKEAEDTISQLKMKGYELILGDVIAVSTAQQMKLNAILISSGIESVQAAISEAVRLQNVINQYRQRNLLFQDIIGSSSLNIVVFDKKRSMIYSNLSDDQMEYPRVFRTIIECVSTVFSKGEIHLARKSKGFVWNINGVKISQQLDELAVFYVEKKQFLPQAKANAIEYYHMLSDNNYANEEPIDTLGVMKSIQDNAEKLGRTLLPILVSGEIGTPKNNITRTLYQSSTWHMHTIVSVDCAIVDEYAIHWLLDSEDSPFCENRFNICIRNIDALDENLIRLYINFARNTDLQKRNRIIYSAQNNLSDDFVSFLNESGCATLHLPPLRDRRNDITGLANLYLSVLNTETGRQALGFSQEAQLIMQEYMWPGNHDQLRRVIRQALVASRQEMIMPEDLKTAIGGETTALSANDNGVSLEGSLDEINGRVIRAVFKQEGLNRARTVKRLGISRTTLWRMLKE